MEDSTGQAWALIPSYDGCVPTTYHRRYPLGFATAPTACVMLRDYHAQDPGVDGKEDGPWRREVHGQDWDDRRVALEPMPFDIHPTLSENATLYLGFVGEELLEALAIATLCRLRGMEERDSELRWVMYRCAYHSRKGGGREKTLNGSMCQNYRALIFTTPIHSIWRW